MRSNGPDLKPAVRDEEFHYRHLVNLLPVAVYTCEASGLINFYNAQAAALWGRTPRRGDPEERFCGSLRLWTPDGLRLPHDQTPMARALREGRPFREVDLVIERPDGSRISVVASVDPVLDGDGRVVGAVNCLHDTTALKRAQDTLKGREERLALVVAGAGAAIWDWDVPARRVVYSSQWKEIRGYGEGEVSDHEEEWSRGIHPDDHLRVMQALQAHFEGHTPVFDEEYRVRHKSGRWIWIHDRGLARRDPLGRVLRMAGSETDITARKEAEQALRASEARKSAILETALDPIITFDQTGSILEFNPAAERVFGFRRADVLGKDMVPLLIPPHLREQHRQGMSQYLATGAGPVLNRRTEMTALRADGSEFPMEVAITRIQGEGPPLFTAYIRDITERRNAEESLRASEERFRNMANTTPAIIWTADAAGAITFHNRRWLEYTGLSPEQNARGWSKMVLHPDDHPRCTAAWNRALATGAEYEIEVRNRRQDGEYRWFLTRATPIRDEQGQVIEWYGSTTDIHEQKLAQESLRESEARFRTMADSSAVMIWVNDRDGEVEFVNRHYLDFFGVTLDELRAHGWQSLLHPDDLPEYLERFAAAVRDRQPFFAECRVRRSDGAWRWIASYANPRFSAGGQYLGHVGTSPDITERKRSEQIMRFLAQASAALAEVTDYRSTLQRIAALAVPAFADWCAVDMREPDGSIQRLAVTHTDPSKVKLAHDLARRYPPQPSDTHGVMNVLRTGRTEWVPAIPDSLLAEAARDEEHLRVIRELGLTSYVCTPLRSSSGILGALTFVTAESGRTYTPTDVAAAEDLAHRAVVAIENANLMAALKEADRRKTEFLSVLAHELRNPLTPISHGVELLGVHPPDPSRLTRIRQMMERQVRQMVRLIEDLMDASRIARGKLDLRRQLVDLRMVIDAAVESSRALIDERRHKLQVEMGRADVLLDADPTRLIQIVLNLLNNAARYTPPEGQIRLTTSVEAGELTIAVSDTGIGFPPEKRHEIFEMFSQAHDAREGQVGLGIGLHLTKMLTELHGGTVEADSPGAGRGSRFTVRMPVAMTSEPSTPLTASVPHEPGVRRRVLVVDDHRVVGDSFAMVVESMGHDVRVARSGAEALEMARDYDPDVIFSDISMPQMDGYELARRLRSDARFRDVSLVAVTGYGQSEDVQQALKAGFDHHMVKPPTCDALQRLFVGLDRRGRMEGTTPSPHPHRTPESVR